MDGFSATISTVIPEREEKVAGRKLLERNNCVWDADGYKKCIAIEAGFFEVRVEESVSINLGSHAPAFQNEIIPISTCI